MEYYATLLVIFLLSISSFTFSIFLRFKQSKLPPGPKPWPIIGNLHQLGNKPHRSITEFSKIYGPLMSLKLGSITTIVISSPEVAKEMFLNHDLDFSSRNAPAALRVINHDKYSMGWLPICSKWRDLRKIATIQMFTNKQLDASEALRQKVVDDVIEYARECCARGQAIDIRKAGLTASINFLSNTIFSLNLSSNSSLNSGDFRDLLLRFLEEGARPNVSDVFPFLRCLDLQLLRQRIGGCFDEMVRVFEEIIDQRLTDPTETGDDVLGNLLKLVQGNELSLDDVKHMLFDFFVAGTDTSSTTLEWAMTELLRNPEQMAKAQTEMDKVLGKDGLVQESDASKLPYIQAIVKETLRLYPPAPFLLPHKAEKHVHFCGYFVPRNAQVWVNVWSVGRDPSVWPNPESFVPKRFLENQVDSHREFKLIPFGEGRRICPGMPLAYRMLHLMLANFLRSFNWKHIDEVSPNDIDVEEKFGIILQRVQPLQAVPLPR